MNRVDPNEMSIVCVCVCVCVRVCVRVSHVVHDNTKTPHITHLGVLMSALYHLWGHVVWSATPLVHDGVL